MVRRVAVIHVAALLHMSLRTCARAPPPPQPPLRTQSQSSFFLQETPISNLHHARLLAFELSGAVQLLFAAVCPPAVWYELLACDCQTLEHTRQARQEGRRRGSGVVGGAGCGARTRPPTKCPPRAPSAPPRLASAGVTLKHHRRIPLYRFKKVVRRA